MVDMCLSKVRADVCLSKVRAVQATPIHGAAGMASEASPPESLAQQERVLALPIDQAATTAQYSGMEHPRTRMP